MILNAKKVTDVCVKLGITAQEFYFLYLIATRDYTNLTRYVKKVDGFSDRFRAKLETKGLLLDYNKTSNVDKAGNRVVKATLLHTSPEFDELIAKGDTVLELATAYDELLEVYPWEFEMEPGGARFNARTGTYEGNMERYLKYIGNDADKHKRILAATKYGKENRLIKFGMEKYIDGRLWGMIEEQMDRGIGFSAQEDLE